MTSGKRAALWAVAAALGFGACSDAYLYDERRADRLPADRTVALEGRICSLGTNEVVRPIKILMALDASQSMRVTDPDGTRAKAIIELLDTLPNDPEIYVSVMVFAGSTTAFLTRSNLPEFEQLVSLTAAERLAIVEKLLNFTVPGGTANADSTDFVKPLADAYALINRDIANSRLNATTATAEARGRYSVIFLSDGHPTNNQDDELLCGDAVVRIRQLKDLAEDVKVNTVHVFNPAQPLSTICDLTGYVPPTGASCRFPTLPPSSCPMLMINQDAERLDRMAQLGGGEFRDFRNNEPINFLNFNFGQVRRAFQIKDFLATNFSAPANSPLDVADSDSDGLTDAQEAVERTDPLGPDTDADGFSDGVEVHFAALGASFRPRQLALPDGGGLDPGCPPALRRVDSDCDGLTDCDEQIIGTNALRTDSDNDGVPDSVEWQLGTQPSSKDLDEDPDSDGLVNRTEVRLHTDPLLADSSKLTTSGYRYSLRTDGPVDSEGRQCHLFRVDNISLANTLADFRDGGSGRGAGYNDLYLSLSMIPGDDPNGRTLVRGFRTRAVRYPVGGIKSPVDGVIQVVPEDLVDRCQPKKTGSSAP
ncbi:MAG: vWA domain-containing protein [Myxococcaceae bacterium]